MSEAPVLVLNAGSSSLKYQLVVPETAEVQAKGIIERIGEEAVQLLIMKPPYGRWEINLRPPVSILTP